jgi:hypothetical protein
MDKRKKEASHIAITCFNCGEQQGHYASTCSNPRRESGEQMLMAGFKAGEFKDEGADFSFWLSTGGKVSFNRHTKKNPY